MKRVNKTNPEYKLKLKEHIKYKRRTTTQQKHNTKMQLHDRIKIQINGRTYRTEKHTNKKLSKGTKLMI